MNFLDIEVDLDPKKSRRPSNLNKNQPLFFQAPSIGGQHALEQDFDDLEIPG